MIYERDDRLDAYEVTDPAQRATLRGVAAVFPASAVLGRERGTFALATRPLGEAYRLCRGERFWAQPSGACGSAFLVAPQVVVTAAHVVRPDAVAEARFVFDFARTTADVDCTAASSANVYAGRAVLRIGVRPGEDWLAVTLDRSVTGRAPLELRPDDVPAPGAQIYAVGHPCGLPVKLSSGLVRPGARRMRSFTATAAAFVGSSGSPVLDARTHHVVGMITSGEADFDYQGPCGRAVLRRGNDYDGETCVHTSAFASAVDADFRTMTLGGQDSWT